MRRVDTIKEVRSRFAGKNWKFRKMQKDNSKLKGKEAINRQYTSMVNKRGIRLLMFASRLMNFIVRAEHQKRIVQIAVQSMPEKRDDYVDFLMSYDGSITCAKDNICKALREKYTISQYNECKRTMQQNVTKLDELVSRLTDSDGD